MTRSPIVIRDARPDDAAVLLDVWADLLPRVVDRSVGPPLSEAQAALQRTLDDPHQATLVAEQDGEVIGAAHLTHARMSPIHVEQTVNISHLYVARGARRRGAARILMAAAVDWAEDRSSPTVMTIAPAHERETNRYLARLGFGSVATVRAAAVSALRAGMLPVESRALVGSDKRLGRVVGSVVAQRRAQRRAQKTPAA